MKLWFILTLKVVMKITTFSVNEKVVGLCFFLLVSVFMFYIITFIMSCDSLSYLERVELHLVDVFWVSFVL